MAEKYNGDHKDYFYKSTQEIIFFKMLPSALKKTQTQNKTKQKK